MFKINNYWQNVDDNILVGHLFKIFHFLFDLTSVFLNIMVLFYLIKYTNSHIYS